jgi:mono/diheme cytochrome c family protein
MLLAVLLGLSSGLAGCDRLDMYDQPRYEPLEASNFFSDGLSARQPVEGTVARGHLREDDAFYLGKDEGKPASTIPEAALRATFDRNPQRFTAAYDETDPAAVRLELIKRGRERFDIHCAPCHGLTGDGDGMIVQRGFRKPPSYHTDRLRDAASGYLFDVISNGFGAMAPFASRIETADRWAIVAYVRALQLSRTAPIEDIPEERRPPLPPDAATNGRKSP